MKNFFTSMLGALVALVIFTGGGFLLFIGFIGAIAAMSSDNKPVTMENGAYLVFDLDANITDSPPRVDFGIFTEENRPQNLQLGTVTRTLRAAAKDKRIAGILLTGSLTPSAYGSGYASLKEVRAALEDFKASGKPIVAYLNFADKKDYYLASVANDVVLDPYGMILLPGLASQPMFYAGAFEKFGIGVQITRVGKYKSYVEPFTRKDMSPENREQVQKLLDDVWGSLVADIAASRNLTPAAVQAAVDAEGLIRAEPAKAAKLIDRIAYRDEVLDELKAKTGRTGARQAFKQISLVNYAKIAPDRVDTQRRGAPMMHGEHIALVYADGNIVDGEGEVGEIGGAKFSRELRQLRQNDSIKAIVLRVNSPGGSASASEAIQREIRLARKVKPVIVSMGSYAASGGYWISAYGDRIFAEPTTITGSIGVFGIQFDIQKLANNIGLTFDTVKTGKFADTLTIARPKTDEELAIFQRMVDWIYGEFVGKVADARHLKIDFVREIAQGRVWSGAEAKKLGLVDEIGGLDAAIKYAAEKADLGSNYRLVEYPREKEFGEALAEMFDRFKPQGKVTQSTGLVAEIMRQLETELHELKAFNDPHGIYARLPLELSLHSAFEHDLQAAPRLSGHGDPGGQRRDAAAGSEVFITQTLGGNITVRTDRGLVRIAAENADALEGYVSQTESAAAAGEFSEAAVWSALKTCFDPEIPVNIVDLGLVYDLAVERTAGGHKVEVKMTLTAQGCGMGPTIAEDARQKIAALPTVESAKVHIVWDPIWTPQMISADGRKVLGLE